MTDPLETTVEPQECPTCKSMTPTGEEFCLGCGYEFSTGKDSVGPFSFGFPEVKSAYEYKPGGAGTPKGFLLMLLFGLGAAVVLGPLVYVTHILAAELGAFGVNAGGCFGIAGIIAYIIIYAVAAPVAGMLLGNAIGRGAVRGQSQDTSAAKGFGLVYGLICFGVFALIYFNVLGMEEGLDSWLDYVKLGWNLITIPALAFSAGESAIRETPFCEPCQKFLKKMVLKRRPIRYEPELISLLEGGDYHQISALPIQTAGNNCEISVWSCDCERGSGYVHMNTHQSRIEKDNNNKDKVVVKSRLVFSAEVANAQLEPLRVLAKKEAVKAKNK